MPFQSEAQRRYLYAKKPEIAKEFASKTPDNANLPEHKQKIRMEAMKQMAKETK